MCFFHFWTLTTARENDDRNRDRVCKKFLLRILMIVIPIIFFTNGQYSANFNEFKVVILYVRYIVCLLLRNAHKMTRQAVLHVCTESEPVWCVFFKSKQTTVNTTTLNSKFKETGALASARISISGNAYAYWLKKT